MINAADVPAERLRMSARLLRDRAMVRGWNMWLYYIGSSHVRIERTDGMMLEVFSATPPTTACIAGSRADDKYLTHLIIQAAGLPVAETYLVHDIAMLVSSGRKLLEKGHGVVVKPLDGAHGHGITVNVRSEKKLQAAGTYALQYSDAILLQAFVPRAVDIRLLCIDYTFVAALVRVPARVRGDGVHTVAELIAIENATDRRGVAYTKELNVIDAERAAEYLGERINDVPLADEWVQVLGTANVGTGGETIDVTDDLPVWLTAMAERAARAMHLPVCGTDFLVTRMPQADLQEADLAPILIEVNKCPSLGIHEQPTYGKARPVVDRYLDYLGGL